MKKKTHAMSELNKSLGNHIRVIDKMNKKFSYRKNLQIFNQSNIEIVPVKLAHTWHSANQRGVGMQKKNSHTQTTTTIHTVNPKKSFNSIESNHSNLSKFVWLSRKQFIIENKKKITTKAIIRNYTVSNACDNNYNNANTKRGKNCI